ncbi:hypothetical protein P7C70_g9275, partial [Phenoliferia sp. Uapishka_3]
MIQPTCSLVGSTLRPLKPLRWTSPSWKLTTWETGSALVSSKVGSQIAIPFFGARVGIFIWTTKGEKDEEKPGRAYCFVDEVREPGINVEAWTDWEFSWSKWVLLFEDLGEGGHTLTCEILEDTSTGGHEFRILGIGSQ